MLALPCLTWDLQYLQRGCAENLCLLPYPRPTPTGASLAQDRGKLEAKIEVLTSETEALKKQNERNSDAVKIKSKIVEDQTETIRKLKEVSLYFIVIVIFPIK